MELTFIHQFTYILFVFETGSLEFAMWLRMTLDFSSSCFHLPSNRTTGMHHHTQFLGCWGLDQELCACQVSTLRSS